MQKLKGETVAAIDVGSNAIRMSIAQIYEDGSCQILDDLIKPTNIGRDTFSYGKVQRDSIHQTCDSLKGFNNLMRDYKIKKYRAVSTSGIREADNKEYVLEQIRLKTGLNVEIINTAQERFLMYKAIRELFINSSEIKAKGTLILDIGSGGVELSIYLEGKLAMTEYIKIGSLRLRELLSDLEKLTLDFPSLMEEFIESRIGFIEDKIKEMNISSFIGLGGELKNIIMLLTNKETEETSKFFKKTALEKLYVKVHSMTTDQIISEFKLSRNQAEILLPSIIIFTKVLKMTKADGIFTPLVSLRHGILADITDDTFDTQRRKASLNDILSSVWYIGKKYFVDNIHCKYIEKLALSIFDQTLRIHRMGERDRLYLIVASILHDVGKHVNLNDHDLHSYFIIKNQDIMGFSDKELYIIANIARYHSGEIPTLAHENYALLSEKHRLLVSKLAAILRLAEALDISHKQKIETIDIGNILGQLHFRVKSTSDILLEESNFNNNAVFFEEVMGILPVIKRKV